MVDLDDQRVVIRYCKHELGQVLSRGVQEGGLYRLLVDLGKHGALVHDCENLCELWHKQFGHLHLEHPFS